MFIINCPHCNSPIIIQQVNCAIFRHACFKNNMQQVPPHAPKHDCDRWIEQKLVYGCARPFQLKMTKDGYEAIICDYI